MFTLLLWIYSSSCSLYDSLVSLDVYNVMVLQLDACMFAFLIPKICDIQPVSALNSEVQLLLQ